MKSIDLPLYKKTKRLVIRPLEDYDYENWAQAYSSLLPPQNEWDETNWDESELTKKKFKDLLKEQHKQRQSDEFYSFGIFRKDDGVLLGRVTLMDISRGIFQNAYLGYQIFNIYWGNGYAQEACKAAMQLAFKNLKLHRVEAGISPANKKSIKTAKALGLRKEGISKRRLHVNGKWTDMEIWALTKEEF
ncbi:GNAT family N-acetyltransferase [Bdellovibrio bacteriovorus]|uniref:GNAT family N-acetyltransferase n=1 Tax=Bdellovibrio bacteriovorus TaxID=959 RepID=UPI0035A5CAC0